ncbi:dimethylallyladenosine tRNA methylthiotransferase [Clostridiales bacterium PH28_bin88]|nr:dimethylallyladenosine tRNA methylthiotransferase [Clostridiales bacterium PH28_bin88]
MILTWGCQMNEHDAEVLAGMIEKMGYHETHLEEDADLIILNTCCVREKAENKVYGKLGELQQLKSKNPELVIGVCGCMTQQPEVADRMRRKAPHVDLIFGTHNAHRLPELIAEAKEAKSPVVEVWEKEGAIVEHLPTRRVAGIRAYVTITYGCNNFCTYCIVPYVRGRERSRLPEDIIREVQSLGEQGYKEIMLLGQNVNSYGKDLDLQVDFADLLSQVNEVPGIRWIRYMTSHPRDFSEKVIKTIARSAKVCEHFHLPVQAGSNTVLRRMHRGYTREYYLELLTKVRESVPHASITTDIIVGFPGESSEDFADTLDLMEKARFDAAFTFLYSPRSGTPAAQMPGQISMEEKKARFQKLLEIQNRLSLEANRRLVGKTVEVLIEGRSKSDPGRLSARTRTNKVVIIEGHEDLIGKIVSVAIKEAQTWNLTGIVTKRAEL